ncbi:DUF421 domain-containing protein [Alkalihalobacillus sp. CinArs1]|uniref:DUF421 domain-containing protein n=1 Tax=Alkalihalobacillus sp. CinArs1 TaxID=2995314 RepID=UPI0022DE019F|nr:YetF domain-containing protein [Alkalihalobacillus sp. CinArs1]
MLDYSLLWKAVLLVVGGTFILRIAGRKSINQMTIAQVVIMIGMGSLIVQPIAGENVLVTLVIALVLVLTLVLIELGELKVDWIEGLVSGRSKMVIKDGTLQEKELKKLRLTVDQLEMKLRHSQISSIEDVQEATMEANGQLGYTLKPHMQAATKGDVDSLRQDLMAIQRLLGSSLSNSATTTGPMNSKLFSEVEASMSSSPNDEHNNLQ